MSTRTRAVLIALFGPALQAAGVLWVLANATLGSGRELTVRFVIFDPGHLIIAVGILVSVVCIPVAFQVAEAAPEDVELGLFQPEPAEQPPGVPVQASPEASGGWEAAE